MSSRAMVEAPFVAPEVCRIVLDRGTILAPMMMNSSHAARLPKFRAGSRAARPLEHRKCTDDGVGGSAIA